MIAKGCNSVNACYPLIPSTKELMDREWRVALNHIYKESNFVADFMPCHALKLPLGIHTFASLLGGVSAWLHMIA